MAITEKQLAARDSGLGSSEVAAILGRCQYRTPWDVWAVKTGRAEPQPTNEAMRLGTALERVLLDLASEELGKKVVAPTATFVRGALRANIDGMVEKFAKGGHIVEAKTTSVTDGWGAPGTAEVPERVMLQIHHQMICAESPRAYVARLSGAFGFSFALYTIDRNEDLCTEIEARCEEWWQRHIVEGKEPDAPASLETLARVYRRPVEVTLDSTLIAKERIAKTNLEAAEKAYDEAKAAVIKALGDADAGTDGTFGVKYISASRTSPDIAEIVRLYPAAGSITKTSTFRRFDVRKKGGAK